ncbi:TPA: DUF1792 domain-containing protein [Morganella morganii]|uniref:GT-D fold domain-containing glycosyltransferase n=1 Tax=Morganella morganii TaxID=582 RepID=UPI0021D155F8|nr:GT-D fold domain-containing glycosyltransferase [Morganella morganii]MCU6352292.1 DUF1792 domain-containing protein [Morganella morganii]HCR3335994.1 DUF1792 domain-containing protein [Morganella morganii]
MKIDLENFVSEFNKEKFTSYYVRNAQMYGWELACIEIETGAFKVALDIDFRGNIWLVFRDYESLVLFQKSLKRDFDFKTLIYDGRNKKYEFSRIPLDETDTVSIARGITNDIIGFYNDIAADFYARKQTELACAIESHQYRDLLTEQCLMKKEIDLFLIAAGPAGTVLSARLADNGKTALDIGNLVSSYNTVFPEQLQAE